MCVCAICSIITVIKLHILICLLKGLLDQNEILSTVHFFGILGTQLITSPTIVALQTLGQLLKPLCMGSSIAWVSGSPSVISRRAHQLLLGFCWK